MLNRIQYKKWFLFNNDHYQILPNLRYETEVWQKCEDYDFRKTDWCFFWSLSFYWLSFSCGAGVSGYLTNRKKEAWNKAMKRRFFA